MPRYWLVPSRENLARGINYYAILTLPRDETVRRQNYDREERRSRVSASEVKLLYETSSRGGVSTQAMRLQLLQPFPVAPAL